MIVCEGYIERHGKIMNPELAIKFKEERFIGNCRTSEFKSSGFFPEEKNARVFAEYLLMSLTEMKQVKMRIPATRLI